MLAKKIMGSASLAEMFPLSTRSVNDSKDLETIQDYMGRHWIIRHGGITPPKRYSFGEPNYKSEIKSGDDLNWLHSILRQSVLDATNILNSVPSGAAQIQSVDDRDCQIIATMNLKNRNIKGGLMHLKEDVPKSIEEMKSHTLVIISCALEPGVAASNIGHELRQVVQLENMTKRPSGKLLDYPGNLTGWADSAFLEDVMEADAWGRQIITATELSYAGHPSLEEFSDRINGSRLVETVNDSLKSGIKLHSSEMKLRVFDAWMTDPLGPRSYYESAMVAQSADNPVLERSPGLSLTSRDLICIGAENDGSSYLDGVNLLSEKYTQSLTTLTAETVFTRFADCLRTNLDTVKPITQRLWGNGPT